jgi:hypothetical protein
MENEMNNDRNVDSEAMSGIEGVDVTQLLGAARPTMDDLEEAFARFQQAFKLACEQPGMRNFRACLVASDHFVRLTDAL